MKQTKKLSWRQRLRNLEREHAMTRGVAATTLQLLQRGFWGRLRWLLRGK